MMKLFEVRGEDMGLYTSVGNMAGEEVKRRVKKRRVSLAERILKGRVE